MLKLFQRKQSYEKVQTNAADVTKSPLFWYISSGIFLIWAATVTVLYATHEDEPLADSAYVFIAKDAMLREEDGVDVGLCVMNSEGGYHVDNVDDIGYVLMLGQFVTTNNETDVQLRFYTHIYSDADNIGACSKTMDDNGNMLSFTMEFTLDDESDDLLPYRSNFRPETATYLIECFADDNDCFVNYITDSDGSTLDLFEGFMEEMDIEVGISAASATFDLRNNCNRSRIDIDGTRFISEHPCPLSGRIKTRVRAKYTRPTPENAQGYGLDKRSYRRCKYSPDILDSSTGTWSSNECMLCAEASDCLYHFDVVVTGNRGCHQPRGRDVYPYCWADFCDLDVISGMSCRSPKAMEQAGMLIHGMTNKRNDRSLMNKLGPACHRGGKSKKNPIRGGQPFTKSPYEISQGATRFFCKLNKKYYSTNRDMMYSCGTKGRERRGVFTPTFGECTNDMNSWKTVTNNPFPTEEDWNNPYFTYSS